MVNSTAMKTQAGGFQESFPNFMSLTDEERHEFFQTLNAARRKLEKSGFNVLPGFGTVHDKAWNNPGDWNIGKETFPVPNPNEFSGGSFIIEKLENHFKNEEIFEKTSSEINSFERRSAIDVGLQALTEACRQGSLSLSQKSLVPSFSYEVLTEDNDSGATLGCQEENEAENERIRNATYRTENVQTGDLVPVLPDNSGMIRAKGMNLKVLINLASADNERIKNAIYRTEDVQTKNLVPIPSNNSGDERIRPESKEQKEIDVNLDGKECAEEKIDDPEVEDLLKVDKESDESVQNDKENLPKEEVKPQKKKKRVFFKTKKTKKKEKIDKEKAKKKNSKESCEQSEAEKSNYAPVEDERQAGNTPTKKNETFAESEIATGKDGDVSDETRGNQSSPVVGKPRESEPSKVLEKRSTGQSSLMHVKMPEHRCDVMFEKVSQSKSTILHKKVLEGNANVLLQKTPQRKCDILFEKVPQSKSSVVVKKVSEGSASVLLQRTPQCECGEYLEKVPESKTCVLHKKLVEGNANILLQKIPQCTCDKLFEKVPHSITSVVVKKQPQERSSTVLEKVPENKANVMLKKMPRGKLRVLRKERPGHEETATGTKQIVGTIKAEIPTRPLFLNQRQKNLEPGRQPTVENQNKYLRKRESLSDDRSPKESKVKLQKREIRSSPDFSMERLKQGNVSEKDVEEILLNLKPSETKNNRKEEKTSQTDSNFYPTYLVRPKDAERRKKAVKISEPVKDSCEEREKAGPPFKDGKVVFVDNNVIEKIKNVVWTLERKTKAESSSLGSEYLVLLLEHVEYLSEVMESLLKAQAKAPTTRSSELKSHEQNLFDIQQYLHGSASTSDSDDDSDSDSDEKKCKRSKFSLFMRKCFCCGKDKD